MTKFLLLIAAAAAAVALASSGQLAECKQRTYDGYSVFRCQPQTEAHLAQLRSLSRAESPYGLQFWTEPSRLNATVDMMVAPSLRDYATRRLAQWQIACEQTIADLAEAIRATMPTATGNRDQLVSAEDSNATTNDTLRSVFRSSELYYRQFHSYREIESKLRDLAELDPRVTLERIGYSYEKRNLYLVKVSGDSRANRPVVFVDAGHHAREWVSHSTATYLIESLINLDLPRMPRRECRPQPGGNSSCLAELDRRTRLDLDNFDYWFLPVVNPDGYEYTHQQDRLWRKTRSQNSGICFALASGGGRGDGVDPNRNYPYHWMEAGASSFACSETYAGPRALSEPETAALARVLAEHKQRIVMYISLHSFSQLILAPYGYGRVVPDNYKQLERVAGRWIESVARLRGTAYEFGTSAIKLYPAAGGSDDYAHGELGIRLAYTIELPDRGRYGFLAPPAEIVRVGQEAVIGLRAMTDEILAEKRPSVQ